MIPSGVYQSNSGGISDMLGYQRISSLFLRLVPSQNYSFLFFEFCQSVIWGLFADSSFKPSNLKLDWCLSSSGSSLKRSLLSLFVSWLLEHDICVVCNTAPTIGSGCLILIPTNICRFPWVRLVGLASNCLPR